MATPNFMPPDIQQALGSGTTLPNSPATPQSSRASSTSQQSQNSCSQTSSSQSTPTVKSAHSSPQTSVVQTTASPQFIAVAVSEQDNQTQGAVSLQSTTVHPNYVQYVDGGGDHGLYSSPNGQMTGYSVYSVSDSSTMYTPATSYYNNGNGTAGTYAQVQWLIDNYETAEGVSLPRSTLYNHYLRHCSEHKLEPVNAASFGKLIRSVFLGLRTRRLGTRGNSKYHYYGIRVKPNSPLNQIAEDLGSSSSLRQQFLPQNKKSKCTSLSKPDSQEGSSSSSVTSSQASESTPQVTHQQHQQYLGDASTAVPNLNEIDFGALILPDGLIEDDLFAFRSLYREQCDAFLDSVVNLQFCMIETLWQTFWRTQGNSHNEYEKILSKSKLYHLCKLEQVQNFVRQVDYQFYQNLVDVLIPDVLRPIPSSLTQSIRNFAKSLEGWLSASMSGCPEEIVKVKISAVSAFSQTLRRYTSLNHLAQAARAVLQNTSQISQMLADLNRVDFHNVQEQASWVCQCDDGVVQRIEADFKATLQQQNSLEQWAAWLEGVVSLVLRPYERKPDFPKAARQFLLKWSFYSSMVIRDLTLRSAASFGSFHLIRLLYDEYMFYLIEHFVAKATGETPIAVMGEFIGHGTINKSLQRTIISPSSKLVLENGPLGDTSYLSLTNGLKEVASLGLLDQTTSADGSDDTHPSILHKKIKIG